MDPTIGNRMMAGRSESECSPKAGGINLELNCVAIVIPVKNCMANMVEWDIGGV